MAKSDLFNDYYIRIIPISSKTACATKNLFSKKVTSAKFCLTYQKPLVLQKNYLIKKWQVQNLAIINCPVHCNIMYGLHLDPI